MKQWGRVATIELGVVGIYVSVAWVVDPGRRSDSSCVRNSELGHKADHSSPATRPPCDACLGMASYLTLGGLTRRSTRELTSRILVAVCCILYRRRHCQHSCLHCRTHDRSLARRCIRTSRQGYS